MPKCGAMRARDERGQAAVETALLMPLALFMFLGTVQLFLMLQGRQMAQYAAFWAAREGSVTQGRCEDMQRVTLKALMPTFTLVGEDREDVDRRIVRMKYAYDPAPGSRSVFWLLRDAPRAAAVTARGERVFDQGGAPERLEVRVVFWYPLRIPFANRVIAQLTRAAFGMGAPSGVNPLMPTAKARWQDEGYRFDAAVAAELRTRLAADELVFPITVTSSMRMMTPATPANFATQNCIGPGAS